MKNAHEGRYDVWLQIDGGWRPVRWLTRSQAESYALDAEEKGISFRIVPSPRTTIDELVE
ncbi:hypothetical protein [Alicyclobacillus macrosporangiidus]|jgi:hypothetical protein|uniref:Uncharacterized protein n=1 Tax=Alicyclobacillus macrosporangiidus TaxID=392015 RepID=A0A1I7FU40_9BACL|nr:hypothetical protein [Alicyclobacillus macrosporangiidus]SFU39693.1 hypothetical protein SAMN05421543_101455 [Alicyclobacillus macrosporangiidus]